jgi:hypothetical protein
LRGIVGGCHCWLLSRDVDGLLGKEGGADGVWGIDKGSMRELMLVDVGTEDWHVGSQQ